MDEENKIAARRAFIKRAATLAATAPAAALLLSANGKPALAGRIYGTICLPGTVFDDATGQCIPDEGQ